MDLISLWMIGVEAASVNRRVPVPLEFILSKKFGSISGTFWSQKLF